MSKKIPTRQKILEAGRSLFNANGYAATSLADIAKSVGISKGNLTYHFPTKLDLAHRLREETREMTAERRLHLEPGDIAEDYVEHLLFGMNVTWDNRFLLRDRIEGLEDPGGRNSELATDFQELLSLIRRIDEAGLFRRDAVSDVEVLTRSIWMVSRYWMDYLREIEGRTKIGWADQERGIKHHFAVLLPSLTAAGRRKFEMALASANP